MCFIASRSTISDQGTSRPNKDGHPTWRKDYFYDPSSEPDSRGSGPASQGVIRAAGENAVDSLSCVR
jgi:hypothetical protein